MLRAELGLTWNEIIHEISYQNLIMLAECTPSYNFDKKEKKIEQKSEQKVIGGGSDMMSAILQRRGLYIPK